MYACQFFRCLIIWSTGPALPSQIGWTFWNHFYYFSVPVTEKFIKGYKPKSYTISFKKKSYTTFFLAFDTSGCGGSPDLQPPDYFTIYIKFLQKLTKYYIPISYLPTFYCPRLLYCFSNTILCRYIDPSYSNTWILPITFSNGVHHNYRFPFFFDNI